MALSDRQAHDAARYNLEAAGRLGWKREYPRIAVLFGLTQMSVSKTLFAHAVHDFQAAQRPPLTKDGKIGPNTWTKVRAELDHSVQFTPNIQIPPWLGGSSAPGSTVAPAPGVGEGPPWMRIAREQERRWATQVESWRDAGVNIDDPETELDWDEAYFAAAPRWGDETHALGVTPSVQNRDWCAAFANYCLHRAGYSHTGSAGAHSFLWRWCWHFDALTEPRQGCVIVVGNSETGRGAHVAFLDRWSNLPNNPGGHVENRDGRSFILLGGNQSGRVNSRREPVRAARDMLASRGRNGVTSPYLWPLVGPANCTISSVIPTAQAHHCYYAPPTS